ncbi:MAG: dTDP-4-dehydrorhamnose 3,5-epimerase [Myxococcota bacterium]
MQIEPNPTLSDVLLLKPRVFRDDRGWFAEIWKQDRYTEAGIPQPFVQDNVSQSSRGVLRGLHMQLDPYAQGKLVTVLRGAVFDVAVDVRVGSPTFGAWVGHTLTEDDLNQVWVPPGFAHGFQALQDHTVVQYKCTAPYHKDSELGILWSDPTIGILWPLPEPPLLSRKDAEAPTLDMLQDRLPRWQQGGPS